MIIRFKQKQKKTQVSSSSKHENYSEQKANPRRREAKHDDGDEGEEEVQSPVRGHTPTPSWMKRTVGGANLSQGSPSRSVKRGGRGGRVSSVFQRDAVAFQAKEVKTKLMNLDRRKSTYHVEGLPVHCAQQERQKPTVHCRQ